MALTFRDLIASNKRKSFWLVVFFCVFFTVTATFLGASGVVLLFPGAAVDESEIAVVGVFAFLLSLFISLIGYYGGRSMILAVSGAKPLAKPDDPELFNVVDEMAIAAGIDRPDIYLINDPAPNAFATGRDPDHAAVAITSGLREKLTRDELQGVIAHEISHIRNYDVRLALLLAVLIGTLAMLADAFLQLVNNSWRYRSRSSDDDKSGVGILVGLVALVLGLIFAIIAPVVAQVIQLAVSREREYLADATAVELTRLPDGLASALKKLEDDPAELRAVNRGTAHLYIVNPVKKFADRSESIFSSHPPLAKRIARLLLLRGEIAPPA